MRFGRFELLRRLGQGGMAEIFIAEEQTTLGIKRLVALKRIRPEFEQDRTFHRAFAEEARLSMRLAHPHIVTVFDVGEVADIPYLSMEWVRGRDLSTLLFDEPMPLEPALRLLTDVGEALAYAHTLGIVHRDVNPANILVAESGVAKLSDFGIAKAADTRGRTTTGHLVKGKYSYLSPEQVRREPLDGRSDVFALGIVAHLLLSGRHPFRRATELATLHAILYEPIPSLAPSVPTPIAALVSRALAVDCEPRLTARAWLDGLDIACMDARVLRSHEQVAAIVTSTATTVLARHKPAPNEHTR